MNIDIVKEHQFDNCLALLDFIWKDPMWERVAWKFRGQGNKDHILVPSALRPTAHFPTAQGPAPSQREQIVREWDTLKLFASLADRQGLPVFGFEDWWDKLGELHSIILKCSNGEATWPHPSVHRLMALAQHHGLPTRILDWTRSPLVGLYFAARYAIEEESAEQAQVTLYALSEDIGPLNILLEKKYEECFSSVREIVQSVDVPYAGNPNITAQRGTFTCIIERSVNPTARPPTDRGLDSVLNTLKSCLDSIEENEGKAILDPEPLLVKLMAPATDAGRLLRRLSTAFGIEAASLFPGYVGAVQSTRDRRLWDVPWTDAASLMDLDYNTTIYNLANPE